jgi:hypothetical protein
MCRLSLIWEPQPPGTLMPVQVCNGIALPSLICTIRGSFCRHCVRGPARAYPCAIALRTDRAFVTNVCSLQVCVVGRYFHLSQYSTWNWALTHGQEIRQAPPSLANTWPDSPTAKTDRLPSSARSVTACSDCWPLHCATCRLGWREYFAATF